MNEAVLLFRARRLGKPVTVTTTTDADLSCIGGTVVCASDMIESWKFVAIREDSNVDVHAAGWRMLQARPWISSSLVAYDKALGAIRTSDGSQYSLGLPGLPDLDPELSPVIAEFLRTQGHKYVRAVAPEATKSPRSQRRRPGGRRHRKQ